MRWGIEQAPEGSRPTIGAENDFAASVRLDLPGAYRISAIYDDNLGESEPWISDVITAYPLPRADIANASSIGVAPGENVELLGVAEETVPGQPLEYRWTIQEQPEGASPTLSTPDGLTTTFVAEQLGSYTVAFVVSDPLGDSSPAVIYIQVQ